MKLLTNLIFEPKGKHDPALAYTIKDTVMSADGSKVYFALQDVPENTPLTDEDFWKLQIDLSGSKSALDEALASFGNYAKEIGTRVKGETAKAIGNPVTFLPDAGSLLQPVTVLEPKQAGSGDPYPAGGGRNLLPNTATTKTVNGVTFTVNEDGTITANGTATANTYFYIDIDASALIAGTEYILSGCPDGGSTSTYRVTAQYYDSSNTLKFFGNDLGQGSKITCPEAMTNPAWYIVILSGVTVSNLTFYPMIRKASDTDATYASYSNIRPITGYDAVELNHAGKNLLPNAVEGERTLNGITLKSNGSGVYNVTGTSTAGTYIFFDLEQSFVLPRGAYVHLKNNAVAGYVAFVFKFDNGKTDYYYSLNAKDRIAGPILEQFIGQKVVAVGVYVQSGNVVNVEFKPMILFNSKSTDFIPYTGNNAYTVQIGETVYGGKMDWTTGKLIAEYGFYALTGVGSAKLTSASVHNAKCFMTDVIPGAKGNSDLLSGAKSSHFVEGVWNSIVGMDSPFGKFGINTSNKIGIGYDGTIDEANAWLAAQHAAGTPVQFAYKLANPIEIQLTPHIISAVAPEQTNTLYGDGSIDVEYVKPLHVSIEERVAAAVAAAINTEGV